jgi:hypothetical protein
MWTIDITAPNGAKGQLTVGDEASNDDLAQQFTAFVETARAHDPEQMAGIAGTAPTTQERRAP